MKLNRLLLIIFGLVFIACPDLFSQAQQRANELLVSTDWLEENLGDSLLVILQSGMKTEFEKEHIPGARYVSIWEILVENEHHCQHCANSTTVSRSPIDRAGNQPLDSQNSTLTARECIRISSRQLPCRWSCPGQPDHRNCIPGEIRFFIP